MSKNHIVAIRHDCDGNINYVVDGAVGMSGAVLWKYPGDHTPYASAKFCAHCGEALPEWIEWDVKQR